MNGAHDLGGMDGLGPIRPEPNEPVFHAAWERRAFALTLACGMLGRWNIDMSRFSREDTDPVTYLRSTYYENWLRGLERLVVDRGLVQKSELESGKAQGPGAVTAVPAAQIPALLTRGGRTRRGDNAPPKFRVGDTVRVKNLHPRGHTRMPRYCRGRVGVIERDHGTFVFPDSNAAGLGENPQRCYSVRFTAQTLWGADASTKDRVYLDLWDDYLESA
jgi:nitrile hydratase